MEECLLPQELNKLTASSGRFLVHLGDIQDGKINSCPESLHIGISRVFEASPVPVFFVIGDNGWLDCDNFDESYSYWEKVGQLVCYFFFVNRHLTYLETFTASIHVSFKNRLELAVARCGSQPRSLLPRILFVQSRRHSLFGQVGQALRLLSQHFDLARASPPKSERCLQRRISTRNLPTRS